MAADLRLRSGVADLVGDANADLAQLWARVASAAEAGEALHDLLPAIVDTYGNAAAAMAAEWYDELREKVGARGRFAAEPVEINAGTHALIGWALTEATDDASFRTLIAGGMQRRIANFARQTVMGAAIADRAADGWQRVGVGANCPFCNMLIGRGAVYSESGADFGAHDGCNCQAQPAWRGEPRPVRPYTPTDRNITDADRVRVREWIASH